MKRLRFSLEALGSRKKLLSNQDQREIEAVRRKMEEIQKAIDQDRSKGAHNFNYAKQLISEVEKRVLATQTAITKKSE